MVRASIFRYVKEFGAVPTDENIQREEVELPPLKNGGKFFFLSTNFTQFLRLQITAIFNWNEKQQKVKKIGCAAANPRLLRGKPFYMVQSDY